VPSPSPGGEAYLHGVAAISGSDAWAVGNTGDLQQIDSLIEHWDGAAWRMVRSPARNAGLYAVAATSARDAWAVGATVNVNGHDNTVIEHWDGTAWRLVPSPSPGGITGSPQLYAVAAISASDAWAVGGYHRSVEDDGSALIEHWNGRVWRQVPSPAPGGGLSLYGVAASSARDAWAVGYSNPPKNPNTGTYTQDSLIEHWNGRVWRQVPSPPAIHAAALTSVTAVSPGDAWAVGGTGISGSPDGGGVTTVARGQGALWTKVPSPSPSGEAGDGALSGVAGTPTGGAWAVGSYVGASGTPQTLIECWNGTTWTR
jgi:hypothetical protein